MAIDWPTVATTVLGSGVVAAMATQGIATFREHAKRQGDGRMVAVSPALALERFGSACAELVADTVNHRYSDGVLGKIHLTMPEMQPLKNSVDLNLLPLRVASMLLEFEASVGQADVDLQDELAQDHFELAMPIFLRLGQAAFGIAREVREKMGFPPVKSRYIDMRLEYLSEQREAFDQDMYRSAGADVKVGLL